MPATPKLDERIPKPDMNSTPPDPLLAVAIILAAFLVVAFYGRWER
jgi:hypothetical protein